MLSWEDRPTYNVEMLESLWHQLTFYPYNEKKQAIGRRNINLRIFSLEWIWIVNRPLIVHIFRPPRPRVAVWRTEVDAGQARWSGRYDVRSGVWRMTHGGLALIRFLQQLCSLRPMDWGTREVLAVRMRRWMCYVKQNEHKNNKNSPWTQLNSSVQIESGSNNTTLSFTKALVKTRNRKSFPSRNTEFR